MGKKTVQIGYNKQLKKPILQELTYDFFAKNVGWEWFFRYGDKTIDIAWHKDGNKAVYELNINGYDKDAICYEFETAEELLEKGRIDGKSLKEIWEELEN